MNEQLNLFNITTSDYIDNLKEIEYEIKDGGWTPFSIDTLQKMSIMYGVMCQDVLKLYEKVTNEQLSNNSKDYQCKTVFKFR